MLKGAFGNSNMVRTDYWVIFSIQMWGRFWLKILSIQFVPPQRAEMEHEEDHKIISYGDQPGTISEAAGRLGHLYGIFQQMRRSSTKFPLQLLISWVGAATVSLGNHSELDMCSNELSFPIMCEDVRSYWMTLRTGEDTLIWKRRLWIALCGGIVLEEALDLSSDRLLNKINTKILNTNWTTEESKMSDL